MNGLQGDQENMHPILLFHKRKSQVINGTDNSTVHQVLLDDLHKASLGLIQIQKVYDIDLKQLVLGHFLGTITKPLSHEDLFLIGSVAWANEMYDVVLSWLQYAEDALSGNSGKEKLL